MRYRQSLLVTLYNQTDSVFPVNQIYVPAVDAVQLSGSWSIAPKAQRMRAAVESVGPVISAMTSLILAAARQLGSVSSLAESIKPIPPTFVQRNVMRLSKLHESKMLFR